MTFNPNMPLSTDIPAQSQAQFLINNQQLNTIFDVDHVTFDAATVADRGKHEKVSLTSQSSDPGAGATEVVLYQKGATPEICYQKAAGATVYQLTNGLPIIASNGSTFLPSIYGTPLSLKWGRFTVAGFPYSVSFASAFGTSCYSVQLTLNSAWPGLEFYVSSVSTNGFVVSLTTGSGIETPTIYYLALGS